MNIKLLEKCLDQIQDKPDQWNQSSWYTGRPLDEIPASMIDRIEDGADAACGTTACLAGHALLLSGKYKSVISNVDWDADDKIVGYEVEIVDRDGDSVAGREIQLAAEELDMDSYLAQRLFHMTESLTPKHFTMWVHDQIAAWPEEIDPNDDLYQEVVEA